MVSKNNMMLLENKQNRKNMRYGIRKFSSGTASVLLGFTVAGTVMMMANHEEASADTVGTQSNTNSVSSTTQNASVPIQSPKSQDVQNAVNNAVKQGVQVTQNNSQTIVAHNTTEVQQAQQRVSQANQQQADKINAVAQQQKQLNDQYAKAKADYDASQANSNDSTTVNKQNSDKLQAAVQAAKAAGVQVTQNQTQTLTATNSTYNSVKQDVNNKYNQQVSSLKSITDAQKDLNNRYNSARTDAQNLNSDSNSTRNSLDSAIRNAKSTNGVKLIDDGTRNVTVDVNNYNSKKAEIERDNRQQADSINSQVQQYKKKLDAYQKNLNSDQINPDLIKQELMLGSEKDAELSYKLLSKDVDASYDEWFGGGVNRDNYKHTVKVDAHNRGNLTGDIIEVTYTNLSRSSYRGKKISKIIATFSNVTQENLSPYGISFAIYSNPYYGFWYWQSSKITVNYKFYDENNHLISFDNTDNSWITIGSLNSGKGRYESVKLNSSGRAYGFKDSSVTIHNGNTLYSDKANDIGSRIGDNWQTTYSSDVTSNYPWGTNSWDKGLDDPHAYYGAGIFKVNGNGLNVTYGTKRAVFVNPGTWATISTTIPKSSSGIIPPTIHYHHTNVALQPPTPLKANYTEYEISTKTDKTPTPPEPQHKSVSYTNYNIVYQATSDKNWKEGSQTVNGKLEINEDIAHAKVDMTVPSPSTVNGKLTHVSLTDNYSRFAKFVTVTGANVYENERNATADYNITNANNAVTATRKNPAEVNGGTVSLVVDFKVKPDVPSGTKLVNSGSGTINTQTVPTPDAQIVTFTQKPTKHWIEGSQVVDGKTYINDDIVTTKVDMDLPNPSQLAKTLSYVGVTDDYRDFKDKAVLQSYKVLENGTDVTSQYTVINFAGLLQAVRKNAATTPAGKVSLIATFEVNHDVKSGTTFTNRGSGRINNHTVDTNTPQIVTFKQDTSKHWIEGSQVVDDKTYINEDMVHGQVTMTLPNRDSLAKALTDVTLVDDYSDYANKVSYLNAQVFENGTDVTSQYTITNAGNKITATRKNPGATPSGSVRLVANFKLNNNVPSGTKLINRGSGRINSNTVNTNEAKILTYVQSTDKHWVEGSQTVDGKTYIANDVVHGQVSMTLPDPKTLATPLKNVTVVDDYRNFMNKVDYQSAQVLENGKDVTSQYTITNANGQVTATRKNASAAPAGKVQLNVNWRIHNDVASGTTLVNAGSGRINNHTVPTPNRNIVTYKQDTLKNWINSQKQIVNDKTVINSDVVHGQIEMTLPDPTKLANKLSKVEIVDDYSNFADKVYYSSADVLENGKNVTSQYNIVNANGHVTATRKDPATTPAGKVVLISHFQVRAEVKSGTELVNKGYGTLNTETIKTNSPKIVTFVQDTDKHWVEGSQVVDGKTYIANDIVNGQVTMTLPDPTKLAEKLHKVTVADDYSAFADKVDYQSAQVLENGKDVTSLYTITNADKHVTATRKDPSTTPGGKVTLNVHWRVHKDVKSGTELVNAGYGLINEELVPTPERTIVTFKQDGLKDWINSQNQVVNGKTYIDNDMVHAKLAMNLPDPKALAAPLTKVQLNDDYTNFAKLVDYVSSQVFENGTDVTSQYTITNANGHVIATRKNAATTPGGKVEFKVNFKIHTDVPSGTTLMNSGEVTLNTETVPTPTPDIVTYKPNTDKHWVEGSQVVDGKTYIANDVVNGQVTMTLPDPTKLAEKLKHVSVTDDYSRFAKMVDYQSAQVLENGKDVTSLYTITNANGHVIATRKDAATAPNGSVTLNVHWRIHKDVKSGTVFVNGGDGRINDETVPTPNRNIVTFKQDGLKDWLNSQNQVVNGKTYIDNDMVHAKLAMNLPDPKALAAPLTKVQLNDDYTNFAKLVDYVSSQVFENGNDVTSQYTITNANGHVIATRKNAATTPGGKVEFKVNFKIHTDVPSGTTLMNSGEVTLNTETVPTPTPDIVTYKPDTDKHWVEGSQVVDGKTYIANDVVNGQVTMTLPDPTKLAEKLKHVSVTDDYSKFASLVDYQSAQVLENGKDVTSQYTITNANGHVIATRKDASTTPGGKVTLNVHWRIHKDVKSGTQLVNSGNGRINDETVPTPNRNIVTFKQDGLKDWLNSQNQVVNGKTYIDNDMIHAKLAMNLPDPKALAKTLTKVQLDDNYSNFAKLVDYVSSQVFENGNDVTSQYYIVNNNGHVIATRKDASKTPGGKVEFKVNFKIHTDVPSDTTLMNSGEVTLNTETIPTPTPDIVTYKPNTDKHWVEGSQVVDGKTYIDNDFVHGQVTMTLPDPTKLAEKLKHVSVTDDYSRFAKMVDYKSAQVLENGKDVTSQYDITNANGKVVATRKDASTAPNGSVTLNVTWRIHTDVKSNTVFVNGGDGRINDETVPTPDRNIVTYKQDGFKDWINSQNQVVNDKTYIDNDVIHAKLVTTLPNPKALAAPLTKVQIDDDYTSYAKMVDYVGARVLENGTDVTSQYTITNANGHVTATRKDPSKAPNGNAELRVDFRIHTDVPSGTKLFNSGSVTLNTETIPTPTPSVETYRQDTDKHWVEGSQVVDGKTYIDGDNVSAQVSMTLPEPSKLAEKLKRVVVTDDFSKFADKVDYKSAKVLENGKDVTAQYDIRVANGHVIATRKDASTTPAGKVVLQAFWKVHNDIESNTQLVNSGSGQINDEVVPTPDRTIVTYKQDTEKHWRDDGGQIVDGKIAINDDVVTARVDMTLPKEENLAKPLDKIQLVDDFSKFADKVTLQAVHVYETGKDGVRRDVTDQYDIHVENGRVVATRKDASKVYDHTGVANATMKATLKANKALNVNDLVHTASANVNDSKVSTVNRLAFTRLFARSFITSNLAVTSDNNIKSQIDMAVPTNVDAKTPMTVTSDYSNFAKYVNVKDATVYENGKNVTADYTIKDDKAGHVTATKKAGSESDGGQVSLVVDYEVNHGIPSGTILENHGSGTLNGQDVPTNTPSITTYTQNTNKHWVEGNQNVDGKIYVNGSTAHAQVSMTLPDQSKLINKLSNVSIDDDYSKFAKLVDYKSAKVLENGKDVTSEYTIKNANGHVTAVRKDASKTPAGNVQLLVDFEIHKDVKSGTELVNGGSGTLNKNTVPTNTPSIWTYTPDGEKHWVLDNNVTDNKIYFSGDKAVAQVSVDLPDASKLATPLNKLVLVDNYSDFADKVKLDSTKVLENGKDVTSEYDLTNKDGKVVATRKDAAKTPSGKAVLVTTFTINNGIENATALHNKGSVTVDSITDEVPDTPIVVFTPKAHKDVELGGDVKGDTENSVDGSLILNGSVVTYPITTSDLPAERAEDVTKRVVKDTLDKNAEFVGFKAWVENDKGELKDVTSHYKLDRNGQDLTFTEDSYLLGLYNKDKSKQTHTPIIDLVVKVKGDAQKINNKATVLTNDNVTETNEVSVKTPSKPTPTKVDKNEKGVNIDGKNVLPGSVNNYELTMDLAKFKGIKVTDQDLAKGFYFVDDYPEEALDVDPQTFTYKTVDGKTVKGLSAKVYQSLSEVPENVATALKANGITPSGAFVLISADDPAQFFKDYVETGTNIVVNAPMKVKEGFAGKYQNKAWQLTFGQGEATDIVSNNVPKIDPKKDIVISADNRTSLNNHTIELGQNFDYLLKGGILDKDQGHDIYEYKWVDDYDENHDQYNGQFIAPLTVDVTLKDGTVLKAGTDISNHVSQNIDTKTGSVEFSVDKDFLDKVDFDKSGFAADILMSVKRIKAGEVDNTYTNIINGQKFSSNTVHSTTPEPKVPETPGTPKTPEKPSVPVAQTQTPATPQPVKMVTSTPAPKAPESPALPQMGDESDSKATAVGLALLGIGLVGMAAMPLDRKRYGLERSSKEK